MPYGLRTTVAPTIEPIDPGEARKHVELTDGAHDTTLLGLVTSARQLVESYTGRSLISRTLELTLDAFPKVIWLPGAPVASVTTLAYLDTSGASQTFTDYDLSLYREPARLQPAFGEVWPATRVEADCVTVTYVAGYGATSDTVPDAIRHAILLLVGFWFENREGVVVGTIAKELPFAVKSLLDAYRTGDEFHNIAGGE